jgi:hypothetical protein
MTNFRFGRTVKPNERWPVSWYHPLVLLQAALDLLSSLNQFRNRDEREGFALPLSVIDRSQGGADDFWFDFIADTGDGGNATYSVATAAMSESVTSQNHELLLRGELLLLGGDLAYPSASALEYRYRFVEMFEAALPEEVTAQTLVRGKPFTLAALPQNHDWMDSASTFGRYFIRNKSPRQLLGAEIPQHQSYFCVRLPHGWWALGLDFAMTGDIDRDQFEQFAKLLDNAAGQGIGSADRVILIYPEPIWTTPLNAGIYPGGARRYQSLEGLLGARIALRLAGDLHHYMRWTSASDGQLVTCGTGGAFTHPTHTRLTRQPVLLQAIANNDSIPASSGQRIQIGTDDGQLQGARRAFEKVKGSEYPPVSTSRKLALGNLTALFAGGETFGQGNRWFALLLGVLYGLTAMLASSPVGVGLMVLLFGLMSLAIGRESLAEAPAKWSAWQRWLLTGGSSLLHALCHTGLLLWLVCVLKGTLLNALLIPVAGALLGTLIFGAYLAAMSWFGFLTNNGYSALALQDFKGFLRFKISTDGALHGYFVAIDQVPRQWHTGPGLQPVWQPTDRPLTTRVHDRFTIYKSATLKPFTHES